MLAIVQLLGTYLANLFKPRCRLEAETLFLRHPITAGGQKKPNKLERPTVALNFELNAFLKKARKRVAL